MNGDFGIAALTVFSLDRGSPFFVVLEYAQIILCGACWGPGRLYPRHCGVACGVGFCCG